MADDSLFLIDVDKILREKAPGKAKYIPRFVVAYLKRIVHQDELNVFLRESRDKVGGGLPQGQSGLSGRTARRARRGKPAGRRSPVYLRLQSSAGRTGRAGTGLRAGETLRRAGEIPGERPADEPARAGTAVHPHQQDGPPGQGLSAHGGGGLPLGQPDYHVPPPGCARGGKGA